MDHQEEAAFVATSREIVKKMTIKRNEISSRSGRTSRGFSIIATAMLGISDVSSLASPFPTAHLSCMLRHHRASLSCEGRLPFALMMSDGDDLLPSSTAAVTSAPSERAQRKAAQRARKEIAQRQVGSNKATSQHPDAVLKRKLQKDQRQASGTSNRRKHNFAQRANFLLESEKINDDFDVSLDGLRDNQLTNTNIHPVENPYDHKNNLPVVHPLHSKAVEKLDILTTTAEDVVKAIKRAQNYHDMHDIREIAHFLLEEVGESNNMV